MHVQLFRLPPLYCESAAKSLLHPAWHFCACNELSARGWRFSCTIAGQGVPYLLPDHHNTTKNTILLSRLFTEFVVLWSSKV